MLDIKTTENLTPKTLNSQTIRHYRLYDDILNESNVKDLSEPYIINSVGLDTLFRPFKTERPFGRKDEYLILVSTGEINFVKNNGEIVTLKPGMGAFLLHEHKQILFSKKPTSFFWVHFTGSQVEETLERFGFGHEFVFTVQNSEKLFSLFKKMFYEFMLKNDNYLFAASTYLLQIFVNISREISQQTAKINRLKNSLSYIHSNFQKDVEIEELARLEGMSISHYRKEFTKLMNTNPKQYITAQRISFATNLLQFTDTPIKEVAEQCGYNDTCYFYRIFKKLTNLTPAELRNYSHNQIPTEQTKADQE